MITIISPAKTLDFKTNYEITHNFTEPKFSKNVDEIISYCKKLQASDIFKIMSVSQKIAELNLERFQNFSNTYNSNNSRPALFAYDGDVYKNIDKISLNNQNLSFASDHLRIISGLYGILKPLDLIQQYRLEMGIKLTINNKKDLYSYWRNIITDDLNNEIENHNSKILLNLCSEEYSSSISRSEFKHKIIDVNFLVNKSGEYKNIGILSKRARGLMANYIIKNEIDNLEDIKSFNINNFKFSSEKSSENNYTFISN